MSIEALKEQARNHEQNEDWAKALEAYEEAIRRQSDEDQPDLGLYNRAGDLSTRLDDPLGAIGHYEQAVELYLESELPNNAIAILKKILRNMPDRAEVYLRMGQIRANQGFLTDARDNFLIYAESMQHTGNMEEAFRALSEFADLAPEDVDIRLTLAELFQSHDKEPEALEQLFRAHHVLSVRGDDAGIASVEERIHEIDTNAVIPDPQGFASGLGTGARATPVFADEQSEGEIAFDGDLDHGVSDEGSQVESEMDSSDHAVASDDGLWAEAAASTEAPADIELDDELDEFVLEDEGVSDDGDVVVAADPVIETALEDAYIDFDAMAEVEETIDAETSDDAVSEAAEAEEGAGTLADGSAGSPDESSHWEADVPAASGWEPEAEHDSLEPAGEASWSESAGDEQALETVGEFDDEPEPGMVEDPSPVDVEDAVDETPRGADGEGWENEAGPSADIAAAADDDLLEEDVGSDLPLLSFDDDGADGDAATQTEDVAVAIGTDEEDADGFETTMDGEDEWIGLDEAESTEAAPQSPDADGWSTGTEFELDTVHFDSLGESELREYVEANPQSGQAWEHMGRLVVARGDQSAAAEAFEAAHAAYAEDRDFHSAMRAVRELLLIDPDSASYHQRLVEYAHRGDDRTLLVSAFLELGDCLLRTGAPGKSDAVYQKVLDIDPGNFRARSALGLVDQSETANASGADYVDLGSMVLEKREKTTRWTVEAEEPTTEDDFDFQDMLQQFRAKVAEHVDHDDVQAHYDLGTAYKEMGLLDEAISEFQQALRADGRNLATFEVLGQSFMEKGQPEVAIRTLKRATDMPFDVEDELLGIYYYLGRAYEELGNRDEAVEYYEKIFALDINFEDVTERLRSLR